MKGHKPVFEALCLIERGELSYTVIAEMFGCDHTTLIYHARRHGIPSRQPTRGKGRKSKFRAKKEAKEPMREPLTEEEFWRGINRGKKSYKDYLSTGKKL